MRADKSEAESNAIRFVLDGQVVTVADVPPTTTVLEYLREIAHRTGSKEGCAEGDCGACTVAIGELSADATHVSYRAINSCIRLLPTIDGHELITVESLQAADGSLHPVQRSMVDHHASQCGFCTPGFVMSLFVLYLNAEAPSQEQVFEALAGNLCRCTGYRPIIDAGISMGRYPRPSNWSREAAGASGHRDALRSIRRARALRLPGWHSPRTIDELAAALEAEPSAVVLAGGTDVGLWVTKQLRDLPAIIYIGEVAELRQLRRDAAGITIGAAVSLSAAWAAIVGLYPSLSEMAQRFGSPPVRNSGTLCGNLANGSPIGDAIPTLIALGATLELRRGGHTRALALEDFYLSYRRTALAPGEFIVSVSVPTARSGQRVGSYKVSKRFDQDISAVCATFSLQLQGERVLAVRLAYGGMAGIAGRARAAENALLAAGWNQAAVDAAASALSSDFQPLTDLRASSTYRLEVAANLLRRFYLEHSGMKLPLRTAAALLASG